MNYYDIHTHVSNSTLKLFRDSANDVQKDLTEVFAFGHLVGASVSERHRIIGTRLNVESGGILDFQQKQIDKAQHMADAYHADPIVRELFKDALPEYAFFRNHFRIEHEGVEFWLPVKCKLDLYVRGLIGGDIKSTACVSDNAFRSAIFGLDYDQQAAWYMDLARLDRFMFIGLGKNKVRGAYPVFRFGVVRGDSTYLSGKRKYSALALKYNFTIQHLFAA